MIEEIAQPVPGHELASESGTGVSVQVAARTANRLEEAEAEIEALRARVVELEADLASALDGREAMEQTHAIEKAVTKAGAIDHETACLLVSLAIDAGAESVTSALAGVMESKPYLFGPGGSHGVGSRCVAGRSLGVASMPSAPAPEPLELAAKEAGRTGDRSALLRYLRLRRSAL